MYKSMLFATLAAVVIAKGGKGGRSSKGGSSTSSKGQREEIEANEFGKYCKPCKDGYEQDPETCKCDAAQWVAAMCKDEYTWNAETCACDGEGESHDAKCLYGYRQATDGDNKCECEQPPTCDPVLECEKGQHADAWSCSCLDKPVCEPCPEAGFKQHPWTCECRSYYTMEAKCGKKGTMNDACDECSYQPEDGDLKTWEPKCRKSYELDSTACACNMTEDAKSRPIKCTEGQGWDSTTLKCATAPECEEVLECEDGQRWDKMACACADKNQKKESSGDSEKSEKSGKSGKSGNSGKSGKSGKSGRGKQ